MVADSTRPAFRLLLRESVPLALAAATIWLAWAGIQTLANQQGGHAKFQLEFVSTCFAGLLTWLLLILFTASWSRRGLISLRTHLRLEFAYLGVLNTLIVLAWYVWISDVRARITECQMEIAATAASTFAGCAVLFLGAVRRWQKGLVCTGFYLAGLLAAAALAAAIAYPAMGFGIVILVVFGNWYPPSLTGAKRALFWASFDRALLHLLFLIWLGGAVYVFKTCWNAPATGTAPSPAKHRFSLQTLLLAIVVFATLTSLFAQSWNRRTRFHSDVWKEDRPARRLMLDDLLRRQPIVDMSEREIVELLGRGNGSMISWHFELPGKEELILRFPHTVDYSRGEQREVVDMFIGRERDLRTLEFRGRHPPVSLGPTCDLETIYRSLQLSSIVISPSGTVRKDCVSICFSLENRATSELNPRGLHYTPGHSMIGRLQQWLVHPNGRRENAGCWPIPQRLFAPGECFSPFEQDLSTLGFQRGQYEWVVELQTVEGKVLQTAATRFVVK